MAKLVSHFPFVGKTGSSVGQKWRNMFILKNISNPTNPQTARQNGVRNALSGIASAWTGLSTANRDKWKFWASLIGPPSNPFDRRTMKPSTITGNNLYASCNLNLNSSGQNAISAPPDGYAYTPFSPNGEVVGITQTAAGSTSIDVQFDFINNTVSNGNYGGVEIYQRFGSPTRDLTQAPKQLIGSYAMDGTEVTGVAITMTTNLDTDYLGQTIYLQLKYVDQNGITSSISTIVPVAMATAP